MGFNLGFKGLNLIICGGSRVESVYMYITDKLLVEERYLKSMHSITMWCVHSVPSSRQQKVSFGQLPQTPQSLEKKHI